MAKLTKPRDEQSSEEDSFYPEEEVFTDSLESITRDLPTGEEMEPADNPGETPDVVLRNFAEERKAREAAQEEEEAARSAKKKSRKRKPGQDTSDDAVTQHWEMSREHPLLRRIFLFAVTFILVILMVVLALYRVAPLSPEIQSAISTVDEGVSESVSPVQNFFSTIVENARSLIFRANYLSRLEEAYNQLRDENEQLVYKAMLADELQARLSQYEIMNEEVQANADLKPVVCSVIGRSDGNYFSTFTINRGRNDGIEEYMAVIVSGALIGYTERVTETQSTVRAIIDSEASIAALIQSSRDQGTIRGTLGIDGTAMCRMYYLPDDHLPRPGDIVVTSGVSMSFPKGIPIGTVRESTRGMDANKQYIVVEPTADFQHIEYVMVLRYKPTASGIQAREDNSIEFVPLETARPVPSLRIGSVNYYETPTPFPDGSEKTPEPEATETVTPSPSPAPTLAPEATVPPENSEPVFEYHMVSTMGPDVTETPSPSPTPTPYVTLGPEDMTLEEDE